MIKRVMLMVDIDTDHDGLPATADFLATYAGNMVPLDGQVYVEVSTGDAFTGKLVHLMVSDIPRSTW
jgi:hypothetical protein